MSSYMCKRRRSRVRRSLEDGRPLRPARQGNNYTERQDRFGDRVVPRPSQPREVPRPSQPREVPRPSQPREVPRPSQPREVPRPAQPRVVPRASQRPEPRSSQRPEPRSSQPREPESRFDKAVRLLASLAEEVRATRRELQELKAQVSSLQNALCVNVTPLDPPDMLRSALNEQSELIMLEGRLAAADDNLGEHVEIHLSSKGGKTAKDSVYRMMPCIMTDALAKTINWTGQGGKMAFKSLQIKDILHRAIRRNPNTKQVTEEVVQNEVIRYLKGASDRDGGRKLKMKSECENGGNILISDVWTTDIESP